MKRLWQGLACFVLVLMIAACGGGGGGAPAALNSYELSLVGTYSLVGFDVRLDGVWYDESDFSSYSGTLILGVDRSAFRSTSLNGVSALVSGNWRADQFTITGYNHSDGSPAETATYMLDGDSLTWDFTDPSTGNREIDYWRRD